MGCVNKSSKEFKELASRNNVASNTLELITHKYWLETGNEELFPTDVYIQAQIGNVQYQDKSKAVRKIWELHYSTPQEFKTIDELNSAKAEASKYFPQSAIFHYKDSKGNHILAVKEPVTKIANKETFFEQYDGFDTFKNTLRRAFNANQWAYRTLTDEQLKVEVIKAFKEDVVNSKNISFYSIKPQYRGKLIYAQSGTGKTTLADNISIFDSDYILGQILGVSTETAGFFFRTLSAEQKKVFGEQYRNAIKEKVAQGYTVVTANESLLDNADIIVYNSSVEQTDERVNRENRAINNRYHAINYHKSTLFKIENLKRTRNDKEYIQLGKEDYLADHILTSDSIDRFNTTHSNKTKDNRTAERQGGLRKEQIISDFLNEFGISVNTLRDYDGELPLFDALNRVINARTPSEITDGVGYAIAFMMQGDLEMQRLIVNSHLWLKGDYNTKVPFSKHTKISSLHPTQNSPIAREIIKEVGQLIASELRNSFGESEKQAKAEHPIWEVIKKFFKKLGMLLAAPTHRGTVLKNERLFVSDIIEALGREDFSRIKGPQIKQGSFEKAQRVDVSKALRENPFEDNIIQILGKNGIALAGSTSIAIQGSLMRPTENPLHDIDFNAGNNSSKESLDKLLPIIFPKDVIKFASIIKKKGGNDTVTYVMLSEPFETRNRSKSGYSAEYYSKKDGRYLGRKEKSELYLEPGVQGKLLDFFVGPTQESNHGFYKTILNGKEYLVSNSNAAMAAKILWARPKDMWDYKNFKRNDFSISENNDIQFAIEDTTIDYTPTGKQTQTYTIKGSHIYNKEGKEVFKDDSVDRNKIFANLAVKQKRAVVVEHKGTKYVVNNKGQIISTISGKIMQWGNENGDRKAILGLAEPKLEALNPSEQQRILVTQLIDHLKSMGLKVFGKDAMQEYLKNHNIASLQQMTSENGEEFFTTPQGEIYGFADKDGNIYLDETIITAEHPIHEYTHLWDRAVQKNNPKLWQRGISLMMQTPLWDEVFYSDNYGKQWQSMGISGDRLTNLIASEVHSRLTGKNSKEVIDNIAKQKGSKKLINHLKEWLKDMWSALKDTFSKWTDKDLSNLTEEQFVNMTLRDFANGLNPNNQKAIEDFINSIPEEQLKKDLHTIEQENNDYDVVNGKAKAKREKQSNVPQDFTFNDGTKVRVPFRPNSQQIDALNAMSDFIKSKETSMTLSGYAGTGKTSLMEIIAKKARKQHKPIIFCASTNKAAAVLNARVSKAGFKASTLNKIFGITVEVDSTKSYNAKNLVNVLKDVDIASGTTVIIDEASMINEENYRILNEIAERNNLKIIYVGDEAQLAPVNENQISKVFRNGDGKVIRLTQVERTDDNAILKEATNIRNGQPLSGESSFNDNGEGVAFVSPQHQNTIDEIIREYVKGLKQNPNFFRILAYTNKAVSDYNTKVRQSLGYTTPTPQVGEPMMGYTNWGYEWMTKSYRFINSESYKVVETDAPRTLTKRLDDGTTVSLEAIPITLEDSLGNRDTFDYIDIKGNQQNRQAAIILANEKKRLWSKARQVHDRKGKAEIYQKINAIDQFLFVNDNIEDENHNTLQAKTIDFGYAMTVHKSQGSTFTHILMDDVDISRASNSNNAANALSMVDLGEESSNVASMENLKTSEDVDLGDLSNVEESTPNQTVNLRQQLEYVGVSRATDTVTVVSNNVKKEGSPLHINNSTKLNTETTVNKPTESLSQTSIPYYEGNVTPDANTIFVFGSNPKGIHGAGAARTAEIQFGAQRGIGEGLTGNAYALPTKDLDKARGTRWYRPSKKEEAEVKEWYKTHDISEVSNHPLNKERTIHPNDIIASIQKLYATAKQHPDKQFKVSNYLLGKISLNGYIGEEMIQMFKDAGTIPSNIIFSKEWADTGLLNNAYTSSKSTPSETTTQQPVSGVQEVLPLNVSLPGYEYMNDMYEDTPVDAEWKIPYLKELDAQITNDKSEDETNNIISKMNKVLQATDEKSYKAEIASSEKKTVETTLDNYEKLAQQIDNLLGDDATEAGISATEIRHTAELIVNSISDAITAIQKDGKVASTTFPSINTKIDFQNATRKEIVEAIGIQNFIDGAKVSFDNPEKQTIFSPIAVDADDMEVMIQASLISENWDAIMTLAADIFALNEGFGITKDYSTNNFTTTENSKIDYDNFNDYSNDNDVRGEESEKDEQEHWQIESRCIDILNSMSALVRQGLHECYLLDENGNKKLSKWGIAERVNPRESVNSILRWTQGSLSLEDMITKLQAKQSQNTWLSQLIQRLSDNTGNETDFQSQFYGVFSKHFQLYSIVLLEDGKYASIPVNSHPALSEAIQTISTQFKIGEHPLFKGNIVNHKLLGSDNTTGKNADFNLHKALTELRVIVGHLKNNETDDSLFKTATNNIIGVCRILGYNVTEDMLEDIVNKENIESMTNALDFIVKDLDNTLQAQNRGEQQNYDPFKYGADNNIGNSLRNFLSPITDRLEDTAINAFYDSGKMYQSYVTPSFLTKLMNKFRQEGQDFEDFIMNEYGSSEWFKEQTGNINTGWRNEWLRMLARDPEARKVFDHKVELNFNKHNYMRNMSDAEYTLSLITEYFAENAQKGQSMVPAWFRIPMQSNKPSSEFIKFYSYRGDTYKDSIINGLHSIYLQELSRIDTVMKRNLGKKDPGFIKNFDTNGRKFNFLPILNAYLEDTASAKDKRTILRNADSTISKDNDRLATLLQKKVNAEEALTPSEETELGNLVDKVLRQDMENRVQSILDRWENNGILETAKNIKGIGTEEQIRANIENFLWNDAFASKNILQLTLTDIAFYKDTEDLQKRLAQLHAPGIRGNIHATDYRGGDNKVSDGKYRTIILTDFDDFISNIVDNINEVFDRRIAAAPDNQKASLIALKDSLTRPRTYNEDGSVKDKGGKYWNINVADAQGYSSPSSYRKKAFIFGRWSKHAEEIYQNLLNGDYKYTDLETAFQPLKPFVYSKLTKDMGVDNAPIHSMQVPFQAKNAEYLLIMADAILKGEQLSRPNLLRAVYRVMEDSAYDTVTTQDNNGKTVTMKKYNGKGIDTVQFESAIKSGLQGKLNIHQFRDMEGGEEAAYTFIMNQIYKEEYDSNDKTKRIYRNYDVDKFVHEASFEDYCLQQEVPEHFKEHSQAHGSQIRMIIPSDLDFYTTDAEGNQIDNYYEWDEPDGTHKKVRADEFRAEYEETIAANIRDSINHLAEELHFNSDDPREKNIALSKILQREIISSPRYGVDLIQACSINKETGEFRIPKGDPIQAKRIEQLINSIIKNRINKQKISGGPIVQVSNFGTSQQLHIRFNDKQGNLLKTKEEFLETWKPESTTIVVPNQAQLAKQLMKEQSLSYTEALKEAKAKVEEAKKQVSSSNDADAAYKEYLKKNQGGIAYFEVFIPIWSNELFEKFSNPDGTINIEAIEAIDPELLKMISYRIPTEDKYSMAPMKAVGFMPREAGDAIMLPEELTEIDDSDFDVDKRYVMRKNYDPINRKGDIFKKKKRHEIEQQLFEKVLASYQKAHNGKASKQYIGEQIAMFLDNPQKMKTADDLMATINKEYQSIAYYTEAPKSGRAYRDNKIIDMSYAVLTNQQTADKILNPGGFDAPKRMGYMVAAYKNPANNLSWDELQTKSIDELKDLSYTDKDLTFADTQVQFYKQNSAAASLIGVFAVNKVAHATLEGNDIFLDVSEICGDNPFIIADFTFADRMQIDPRADSNGTLLGKTLGSLVSASADAVKDPILNLMNINMTTAGMLNTMLRLGMTFDDAALFLSQNIIERTLNQFNKENLGNNYQSLDKIINSWITAYESKYEIKDGDNIKKEALNKEELINGLTSEEHEKTDYKVLLAFQKLRSLTDAMRKPTYATRFNSISSAVGPLIIDNLIMEHKMEAFMDSNSEDGTHFYTSDGVNVNIDDIFYDHPILKQFARTVDIAKSLFSDMPTGSKGFRNLLDKLPSDISDKIYNDKKLLDQLSNFYQSYLLVQSGMIDANHLKGFIERFPKKFMDDYKEKYPENALIQAIRMNVSKKTGKPFLSVSITGMDEQKKEELRNAWIDLHKTNPELSQMLFEYSFFRAGVGFSPKTFMALVPTYVKERLKSKNGKASYVDTYRHFPEVVYDLVIDQFIRNNWNNNKLVPKKGGKNEKTGNYPLYVQNADYKNGILKVTESHEIADLSGLSYIKTSHNKQDYLWKYIGKEGENLVFHLVKPLGNNGEYLEMSLFDIQNPLNNTTQTEETSEASDLKTDSPSETDAAEDSKADVIATSEKEKNISELIDLIMKQNPKLNLTNAKNMIENIKKKPTLYIKFLQNVYKQKGLELNKEEVIEKVNKLC